MTFQDQCQYLVVIFRCVQPCTAGLSSSFCHCAMQQLGQALQNCYFEITGKKMYCLHPANFCFLRAGCLLSLTVNENQHGDG